MGTSLFNDSETSIVSPTISTEVKGSLPQSRSDFTSVDRNGCHLYKEPSPAAKERRADRQAAAELAWDIREYWKWHFEEVEANTSHWFKVIISEFPQGQFEGIAYPYKTVCEPSPVPPDWVTAQANEISAELRAKWDAENKERSARRARRQVRHLVKAGCFNQMGTFTTRAAIYDRETYGNMVVKALARLRKVKGVNGDLNPRKSGGKEDFCPVLSRIVIPIVG